MSVDAKMLMRLAAELQRALVAELGMGRGTLRGAAGPRRTAWFAPSTPRRPTRGGPSRAVSVRMPVVVVEVPAARERPTAPAIGAMLNLQKPFDLYYVVPKHWAALQPRELNPDDRDRGHEHLGILRNLRPDYALLASADRPPAWTSGAARLMTW